MTYSRENNGGCFLCAIHQTHDMQDISFERSLVAKKLTGHIINQASSLLGLAEVVPDATAARCAAAVPLMRGTCGPPSVHMLCVGVASDRRCAGAPEAASARPRQPYPPSWRQARSLSRTKSEAKTGSRGPHAEQGRQQHSSVSRSDFSRFSDELMQRRCKNQLQSD